MKGPIVAIVILSIASLIDSQAPLPRAIRVCRRNGPPLSECVKQSIELLRPSLKSGNYGDGFEVEGIDPLTLDDIHVRRPNFQADLHQMIVTGASSFVIEKIKVDFDNPMIDVQVIVPKVDARGFYQQHFDIGILNSRAKGRIINHVSDLRIRLSFKGHQENRNGRIYVKFDKFNVAVKIRKIRINMENTQADKALNDAVNNFVNANPQLFLPEVESAIRHTLGRRMQAIVLKVFDNYPLDVVYP